jgi:hypothetical protein
VVREKNFSPKSGGHEVMCREIDGCSERPGPPCPLFHWVNGELSELSTATAATVSGLHPQVRVFRDPWPAGIDRRHVLRRADKAAEGALQGTQLSNAIRSA